MQRKLLQHVVHVTLDGVHRNVQPTRNLLVAEAFAEEIDDLSLAAVRRTASITFALSFTATLRAICEKSEWVNCEGRTCAPPATARMVEKNSSNEASFMTNPDAPART
jgi:hypothetical protein